MLVFLCLVGGRTHLKRAFLIGAYEKVQRKGKQKKMSKLSIAGTLFMF